MRRPQRNLDAVVCRAAVCARLGTAGCVAVSDRSLHAGACCTERTMPCDELASPVVAYALIQRLKGVGCLLQIHSMA